MISRDGSEIIRPWPDQEPSSLFTGPVARGGTAGEEIVVICP
jgi:hypothetical protein